MQSRRRPQNKPRQSVYALAQIRIAAGDVDPVRAGKIVQHGRISSTSIFSCSASQPGQTFKLTSPIRSVTVHIPNGSTFLWKYRVLCTKPAPLIRRFDNLAFVPPTPAF